MYDLSVLLKTCLDLKLTLILVLDNVCVDLGESIFLRKMCNIKDQS